MKHITFFLFLFTSLSFSQTEKQLIEDNCNCSKGIDKNIEYEEKKKMIMNCSLNAFKKNRSYTEKVVKQFTGKSIINGKDVFKYLEVIFDKVMVNQCEEYKVHMIDIMGINKMNSTIKKISSQVCNDINVSDSEQSINSKIQKLKKENNEEIIQVYGEKNEEEFLKELYIYLFYNCDQYRIIK